MNEILKNEPNVGNKSAQTTTLFLAAVPLGILLNLGIGTLVHVLKLPLFVEAANSCGLESALSQMAQYDQHHLSILG